MIHAGQHERLIEIVRGAPSLMRVLETARAPNLPDWRLVSGAIYQRVWNAMTGRSSDYGVKDYDLAYFDPNPSWEAEDIQIRRAAAFFPGEFSKTVEVRNQGRVHLWFEEKFGDHYAPLTCTDDMVERFLCPAFALGVRLEADGRLDLAAPFGLEDCFAMRLRPNPRRAVNLKNLQKVIASCRERWPEVEVVV